MSQELSVVVPVHNEIESLPPLVAEIGAALDGQVDYELVFVDDGSDDGTAELLSTFASRFPRLRLVRHRKRAGQSAAIATGVQSARAPWIVTLDGDGQNDPADILTLLAAMRDPAAPPKLRLVIGERRQRQERLGKRVAGSIANTIRARLLGDGTPDTRCGLKLFTRAAFLAVPQFNHMHRFLPALFLREGWRVASVPVSHRPRRYGRSHYGVLDRLWVGFFDIAGLLWLQRRRLRATIVEDSDER